MRAREVRDSGIRDFFDLADALLDPVSVQTALSRLDRATLATLAVLAEADQGEPLDRQRITQRLDDLGAPESDIDAQLAVAEALALVDTGDREGGDGPVRVWDAVASALLAWPSLGLPSLEQLAAAAPAALGPVSELDRATIDAAAADRAFHTATTVGEMLAEYEREPARTLAKGGLALPDSRRLAAAAAVELDVVPALHELAARAELIALEGGSWLPTTALADWMLRPTAERWARLAGAWFDRLPHDARALLSARTHTTWGGHFGDFADWVYPAGGNWMRERYAVFARDAELLGIISSSAPSSAGSSLFTEGPDAAAAVMAAHFPREITTVYVQHDLSIVSPGPLEPRLDSRLRTMTDVESRALAATYRVSAGSLTRALASGETAETIRAFLGSISLTGIPQPLEYLITESAARYGLVRVGAIEPGTLEPASGSARSYIRSPDEGILGAILVDQTVSMLGLRTSATGDIVSRFDAATVFWALSDARYPVAAENADGAIVVLARHRASSSRPAPSPDPAASIVERLRLLAGDAPDETGRAWLERQLEAAIRAKVVVTVTVTMPDGADVDYLVQPSSLSGGRLRALDRGSDIERTLPVARITAVRSPD